MSIITREFTYRNSLKISKEDMELARRGQKRGTVRLGKLSVSKEVMDLTDGNISIKIKIVNVDNSRLYEQLTDDDARVDGFSTLEELQKDLRKFYRNIDQRQPMTVIQFALLE